MNQPAKQHAGIVAMLSIMMFLQFFAWGSWFATLSAALDTHQLGDFIGRATSAHRSPPSSLRSSWG